MSWRSNLLVIFTGMVILYANSVKSHRTMEQMEKAAELMRTVCMTKTKPILEDVEGVRFGKFPENSEIKCYTKCALEMMAAMRKGKVLIENAIKQTRILLPPEHAEPIAHAFDVCRHAADGIKNHCEVAYALVKCSYENNPKFFFP